MPDSWIAPILDLRQVCRSKQVVIIGDLHGCFDELRGILEIINWNPDRHVIIFTGDLNDRGPKIKETLDFARSNPDVYTLMSNHEWKLLRYLRGKNMNHFSLAETIRQCGIEFLNDSSFIDWLSSLPYIIRWSDDAYVVHAGIVPSIPIDQQEKETCIYIRTWVPGSRKLAREGIDPPWYNYDYLSSRIPRIKVFFGHQTRESDPWVSSWACAMDAGVVFGGKLRACVDGTDFIEVPAAKVHYQHSA